MHSISLKTPLRSGFTGSTSGHPKIINYVYLVPFVENEEGKFLKTIIPSRKATREYLGG